VRLDRAGEKPVPKAGPAFTDTPTLAELGVDKKHAARARLIATIPPKKLEMIAADLESEGKAVTPSAVLSATRKETKRDKIHAVPYRNRVATPQNNRCQIGTGFRYHHPCRDGRQPAARA